MVESLTNNASTIPQAFLQAVQKNSRRPPLRHKYLGLWRNYAWPEYYENVARLFYGLRAAGLQKGDRVTFLTRLSPIQFFLDMAIQCAGGVPLGFVGKPEQLYRVLDATDTRFIICQGEGQLKLALALRPYLPGINQIIAIDSQGLEAPPEGDFLPLEELLASGESMMREDPTHAQLQRAVEAGGPDDEAVIFISSEVPESPKAILHTHRSCLAAAKRQAKHMDVQPGDVYLAMTSLATPDRVLSQIVPLFVSMSVHIPEGFEPDVIQVALKESHPTHLVKGGRQWNLLARRVLMRLENAAWFNRAIANAFLARNLKAAELRLNGNSAPIGLSLSGWLGDWLVFRWIRARLGFTFLRNPIAYGDAVGPEAMTFFHAIGVPLRQYFGQKECFLVCGQTNGKVRRGTVGMPLPGVQIHISDDGEVLVQSKTAFKGYLKLPQLTEDYERDGWLRTGDLGEFSPDGHLVWKGRKALLQTLPGGAQIASDWVESRIRFSPYITEAVVFVHEGSLTALVQIDFDTVGDWAQKQTISYTRYEDLVARDEVRALIEREIDAVNQGLPAHLRIQRSALLPRELTIGDDELTYARKIQRNVVLDRYKDLWSSPPEEVLPTTVALQEERGA